MDTFHCNCSFTSLHFHLESKLLEENDSVTLVFVLLKLRRVHVSIQHKSLKYKNELINDE